ncbi:MAG: vanadium-dependent haloperoxidase [Gaiellales bacterium]
MESERHNMFEAGRPAGALPGLTRRELVVRGGLAFAGLTVVGAVAARARASTPFPGADQYGAEVPAAWFDLALDLVQTTPGYSPPVASRAFAYAGLALYEALVPGMDGFQSLGDVLASLDQLPTAGKNAAYDWPTVANAGLASILRSLFPTGQPEQLAAVDALESSFIERLRAGLPAGVFARSVRRGQDVAAALFEWSKGDGGHEGFLHNFPPYDPPVGPGYWVPTPPGFLPALQPYWGSNRCLAVANGAACPPGDHPPFSEDRASVFYGQALEVYEAVNQLSQEQEEIARFWSDDPGQTPTPPGHSISIATQVLRNEDASLATAAETYAKVGMAICDAFIACWYQKYSYNLIRPVSYLQRLVDPDWLPLLVTPPFPEYTSGHSIQSGAAFQTLTDLFGEGYAFVDHTHDDRGLPPRSFGSFLEAAEEAAISRLYGGIHFRSAIVNGVTQGKCIGQVVSALPLLS